MTQTIPYVAKGAKKTAGWLSPKLKSAVPRVAILLFALLSTVMAIRSDGAWIDDDLCHYQIARAGWTYPRMLLSSWGRPGCTIPYALVAGIGSAQAGFMAARLLTVAMSVLVIWLTWRTARRMRAPGAFLAPLILLLMPEFFWESFTPCTEIPAALYAIAGVYCLSRGWHRRAAVCLAILPATRHELAPFLVPIGFYFLWRRDFVAALLLCWFEVAWAAVSWKIGDSQPILRYFTPQDSTPYGSGNFYHYFLCWMKMSGFVIVVLSLTGAAAIILHECGKTSSVRCLRRGTTGRRARLRLLVVGGALGLVVLETVLFAFNRFASGGYSTFLLPAAPLMAICACYGVAIIAQPARGDRRAKIQDGVMVVFALIALTHFCLYLRPHRLTSHQNLVASTIADLKRRHPGCHIVGDSLWITYFDEISPGARERNAIDTWTDGQAADLYFIHDYTTGVDPMVPKITAVPCERVATVSLAGSNASVDLLVFRRLADATSAR
jgi:hypothetical protein